MRSVVRIGAWVVSVVIVVTVAAGWLRDRPELTAADAGVVAVGALAEVGFDATLSGEITAGTFSPADAGADDDPIPVWDVVLDIDGELIETQVKRDAGVIVFINDNIGVADPMRLLTQAQFEQVDEYRDDTLYDEQFKTNGLATGAGLVGLIVALAHTVVPFERTETAPTTQNVSQEELEQLIS